MKQIYAVNDQYYYTRPAPQALGKGSTLLQDPNSPISAHARASATADASAGLNSWRVSPVASITICVAMATENRFKELTGAGFTAAVRRGDGRSELIRSFDPTAKETLFFPRLQGG